MKRACDYAELAERAIEKSRGLDAYASSITKRSEAQIAVAYATLAMAAAIAADSTAPGRGPGGNTGTNT